MPAPSFAAPPHQCAVLAEYQIPKRELLSITMPQPGRRVRQVGELVRRAAWHRRCSWAAGSELGEFAVADGQDVIGLVDHRGSCVATRAVTCSAAMIARSRRVAERPVARSKWPVGSSAVSRRGMLARDGSVYGASIGASLEFSGARLEGSGRLAVRALGLKVGADLILDQGFAGVGSIDLFAAEIGGQVWLNGARAERRRRAVGFERSAA